MAAPKSKLGLLAVNDRQAATNLILQVAGKQGNKAATARKLGVSVPTFNKIVADLGIADDLGFDAVSFDADAFIAAALAE